MAPPKQIERGIHLPGQTSSVSIDKLVQFLRSGALGPVSLNMAEGRLRDLLGTPDAETLGSDPAVWRYGVIEFLIEDQRVIGIEIDMEALVTDGPSDQCYGVEVDQLCQMRTMNVGRLQGWMQQIGFAPGRTESPAYDPTVTLVWVSPRVRFVFQDGKLQTISALLPPLLAELRSHKDFPAEVDQIGPEVLIADIDGFKWFNDQHGFAAGDKVIQQISRALCEVASKLGGATVFRVGGDEFLVTGAVGRNLQRWATEIRDAVRQCGILIQKSGAAEPSTLDVNVVLLRMTVELGAKAFGTFGLTPDFREWMSRTFYARKLEMAVESGVIVDCRQSDAF